MQYLPGTFEGTHFAAVDSVTRFMEFGKDSYAAQCFSGTPEGEDVLLLALVANLQCTSLVPTAQEGWRVVMTLLKRLFEFPTNTSQTPAGWNLVALPVDPSPAFEPDPSAAVQMSWNGSTTVEINLGVFASRAFYLEINATNLHELPGTSANSTDVGAALTFALVGPMLGEALSGSFLYGFAYAYVDRSDTYSFLDLLFADRFVATVAAQHDGVWKLSAVFHRSVLQVFVNGGMASATMLISRVPFQLAQPTGYMFREGFMRSRIIRGLYRSEPWRYIQSPPFL